MSLPIAALFPDPVTGSLVTLSLAVVVGLALGAVRVRGVNLGVAAVLFSAVCLGAAGMRIEPHVLDFLLNFALIVFVYTIGLQLGPGFGASLRAEGMRLNVLALSVVGLGAAFTFVLVKGFHLPGFVAPGIYAGGYATTPALAAGQEALLQRMRGAGGDAAAARAGLAFAVGYPFGMLGPIGIVLLFKFLFNIDLSAERAALKKAEEARRPPIETLDVEITSPQWVGRALREVQLLREHRLILSRMLRGTTLSVPTGDARFEAGDVVRAVGTRAALAQLAAEAGREKALDVTAAVGVLERRTLVVTHRGALGRSLRELDLINKFHTTVTRVYRAGIVLPPRAERALKFGDQIDVVGPVDGLESVEQVVGNSLEVLNRPQLIPIFLGILLGVIVGSIPVPVPGLGGTLKIGLAGGPMLVAILLSRLGNVGSVVWYLPTPASNLFRDFGMALFLACIGLQSGAPLVGLLRTSEGWAFIACAAAVTLVPMLLVGLLARLVLRMNFVTLAGLTAGAMTSSPTLLFANEFTGSDAPAVAYAAVYPISMLFPIFGAQLLVAALT